MGITLWDACVRQARACSVWGFGSAPQIVLVYRVIGVIVAFRPKADFTTYGSAMCSNRGPRLSRGRGASLIARDSALEMLSWDVALVEESMSHGIAQWMF